MMQNSVQQKMFKRIMRWEQSGLNQKAWCEKNKMAYATFHYWYKRYRVRAMVVPQKVPNDFIKLSVNDSAIAGGWCELALTDGKRLVFQQPVSAEFLRMLIA
jgi:hypothetical protein